MRKNMFVAALALLVGFASTLPAFAADDAMKAKSDNQVVATKLHALSKVTVQPNSALNDQELARIEGQGGTLVNADINACVVCANVAILSKNTSFTQRND